MSDETRTSDPTRDDACQFPTGPNAVCGAPVVRSGAPGRPARYCANPDHARVKAFAARRALERVPAGLPDQQQRIEPGQPDRPVTDGRTSLGALLSQVADTATRELERVQAESAKAVAAAQADAELVKRQTIEDCDRMLAGCEADMRRRIEQAQAELVTGGRAEVSDDGTDGCPATAGPGDRAGRVAPPDQRPADRPGRADHRQHAVARCG